MTNGTGSGDRSSMGGFWKNPKFWLIVFAVILPFGWAVLLLGAIPLKRLRAQRPTPVSDPYTEWLSLRQRSRANGHRTLAANGRASGAANDYPVPRINAGRSSS